jgi:hypothetical protein
MSHPRRIRRQGMQRLHDILLHTTPAVLICPHESIAELIADDLQGSRLFEIPQFGKPVSQTSRHVCRRAGRASCHEPPLSRAAYPRQESERLTARRALPDQLWR